MYRVTVATAVTAACILTACHQSAAPPTRSEVATSVGGRAARALDAHSRLALAAAPSGELSEGEAKALVIAYAQTASRWLLPAWEKLHEGNIELISLTPCGRAFYARSVFTPESVGAGSKNAQRRLSGRWLFTLCDAKGSTDVSVAVAANATDLQIVHGVIKGLSGEDFLSFGIPPYVKAVPPSPEDIAVQVARITGRRIVDVPELVLPSPRLTPQLARWRLKLDAPVTVRGVRNQKDTTTDEVYFGFVDRWQVQGLLVGRSTTAALAIPDPAGGKPELPIVLAAGYTDKYEPISVER